MIARTGKTTTGLLAIVASFGIMTPVATADFIFTNTGPLSSAQGVGDPDNSIVAGVSAAGGFYSRFDFSGNLTEVQDETWASEARFNIRSGSYNLTFQPSTTRNFTGTLPVSTSTNGAFWAPPPGAYEVETFESFDDGTGTDATWSDVSFSLNTAPSITDLGAFGSGSGFAFDTFGSAFDTELALYTLGGLLIGFNDDAGGTLQSIVDGGMLADDDYFAVLGGFNSRFLDYAAYAGPAAGDYTLSLNGDVVSTGALASSQFSIFQFTVGAAAVPEPGTILLVSLGLLGFGMRKKSELESQAKDPQSFSF